MFLISATLVMSFEASRQVFLKKISSLSILKQHTKIVPILGMLIKSISPLFIKIMSLPHFIYEFLSNSKAKASSFFIHMMSFLDFTKQFEKRFLFLVTDPNTIVRNANKKHFLWVDSVSKV
jgi:hypothetical protein